MIKTKWLQEYSLDPPCLKRRQEHLSGAPVGILRGAPLPPHAKALRTTFLLQLPYERKKEK